MDPRLYNSAKSGNIFHFKQLVNENPRLLLKLTPHENTPLHIAARFGHKNMVAEIYNRQQSLLAQPNLDGDTPLHVAVRAGHFSTVSFLVEEMLSSSSHRDIENRPNRGGSEIVRMRNKWNNTVLHEAVKNHRLSVAEFLIKVDPELARFENNMGESPLYVAARDGMLEIVNCLLMAASSSAYSGSDGQTALHAAVVDGHFDVVEALVRAKPNLIKETDHHGRTPLYYAASLGDHKIVQKLLQLDTDAAYMLDKDGQSPLHVAACKGHTNVIKEIIRCCPDSGELLDLRGQNTLHIAVLGGKLSVVKYILETTELEGLINQADNDGNTPLHLATRETKTWIARYLMWDERVDKRAKNNIGQKAIDDESSRKSYLRLLKTSRIWRQPWSLNTGITGEKIPPYISGEGAAVDKMETYKQMGHTLLMVTTLIATVTFAAAFTIPGGFNNNVGSDQGMALLQSSIYLKWFLISDSIAMTSSVVAACILFWGGVIADKNTYVYYFVSATMLTHFALSSTGIAFATGLIAVMPNQIFVRKMCFTIGLIFHVVNGMFFYLLVRIFPLFQIFQFLIYRLCRLKTKFIER